MKAQATFSERFFAGCFDALLFLPFSFTIAYLGGESKTLAFWLVIPSGFAFMLYTVYCHARYGQTLGKRAMGISVVLLSGEPMDWRAAWLRSSVDGVFCLVSVYGSFVAVSTMSDSDYYGATTMVRLERLSAHQPVWTAWAEPLAVIWFWSEVVVMLCNAQRRALHDYLAGTMVITQLRSVPSEAQTA